MTFDSDVTACADLVRRADPDRFLAVMAAPVAARQKLFPIYAMNVEVSRAPWVTAEPMIAEMRLQWWRDALAEIAARGDVRHHEVTTPLARILSPGLAMTLDEYVAVRRWDIYKDPFEDEAHFDAYLNHSAASLLWAAVSALGAADEAGIRDLGWALGLANWFRAIPALEAQGRVPLLDGTSQGVRRLAEQGLDRLARGRLARRAMPAAIRPALLVGWQTRAILEQAARDPALVRDGGLGQSEAMRRLSLMVRALGLVPVP